jgi:hypothetical protein
MSKMAFLNPEKLCLDQRDPEFQIPWNFYQRFFKHVWGCGHFHFGENLDLGMKLIFLRNHNGFWWKWGEFARSVYAWKSQFFGSNLFWARFYFSKHWLNEFSEAGTLIWPSTSYDSHFAQISMKIPVQIWEFKLAVGKVQTNREVTHFHSILSQ